MEPVAADTSVKMEPGAEDSSYKLELVEEETSDKVEPFAEVTSDKMEPNTKDSNYPTFVKIRDEDDDDNTVELPCEEDGTILLSTIQAQFPTAVGLKYNILSCHWKCITAKDNVLHPPSDGWGGSTYYITEVGQGSKYVNKYTLRNLAKKGKLPQPTYETINVDNGFLSTVTFNGNQYKGVDICKTHHHAEQTAALVALNALKEIPWPPVEEYDGIYHDKEQSDEYAKPIPPMFKGELGSLAKRKNLPFPTYKTFKENDGFVSTVTLDGKQYKGMGTWATGEHAENNAARVAYVALTETSLQCDQQQKKIVDKDYSLKRKADEEYSPPPTKSGNCLLKNSLSLVSDEKDSPPSMESVKSLSKNQNRNQPKLVILGLHKNTKDYHLKEYFTRTCGEMEHHRCGVVRKKRETRLAFISFNTEEATMKALNGQHEILGKTVRAKKKDMVPAKLFVDGIPEGTTEGRLKEYFSQFGDIENVSIPQPYLKQGSVTFVDDYDREEVFLQEEHKLDGVLLRLSKSKWGKTGGKKKKKKNQDKHQGKQKSFKQQSFNKQSFNPQSFNQQSPNHQSFNQQSFNQQSFSQQSLNRPSFNQQLLNQESRNFTSTSGNNNWNIW